MGGENALFSASLAVHTFYMYDGHYMEGLCYKCSYLEGIAAALAGEKRQEFHPSVWRKQLTCFLRHFFRRMRNINF